MKSHLLSGIIKSCQFVPSFPVFVVCHKIPDYLISLALCCINLHLMTFLFIILIYLKKKKMKALAGLQILGQTMSNLTDNISN